MAQPIEVTPDGWIVTDLRAFHALIDHDPPRPWGYWDQIRCDLHEPKIVWGFWVQGVVFTAAGAALPATAVLTGHWLLLLGGILLLRGPWVLAVWVRLARGTVHAIRTQPFGTGVVGGLEPHPIVPTIIMIGLAIRPSGESVDVGVGMPLARATLRAGTPAEVWFVDDPSSQYKSIFATRPVATLSR